MGQVYDGMVSLGLRGLHADLSEGGPRRLAPRHLGHRDAHRRQVRFWGVLQGDTMPPANLCVLFSTDPQLCLCEALAWTARWCRWRYVEPTIEDVPMPVGRVEALAPPDLEADDRPSRWRCGGSPPSCLR